MAKKSNKKLPAKRKKTGAKKRTTAQKKKSRLLNRLLRFGGILFLIAAALIALFVTLVYVGAFGPLPDKMDLKAITNEEASLVFSSDNKLIGKYFAENRTNILQEEVPEHLKQALVATEDKRFFLHKGYDTRSYLRVLLRTLLLGDRSGGGGSTLTQQLVKNLYGRNNYGFLSMPVSKLKEAIIASRFEEVYNKEELLLLYLNSVPFGEDVYGVESAARRYFNKSTRELRVQESAVLVGMLKANTYFNPRLHPENSIERRNMVLSLMAKENYLTEAEADSLQKLPLKLNYENISRDAPAGYFVYQVRKRAQQLLENIRLNTGKTYNLEKDGLRIYTTLNFKLQTMALESVKKQLSTMQPKLDKELITNGFKKRWYAQQAKNNTQKKETNVFSWSGIQTKQLSTADSLWHYYKMLNAAVLILDPKDGAVKTWVGGNHFRYLPFDMVLSHRQIASAFKPILYATALEEGYSPCTYLENEEKTYINYDDWQPQNFNHISTPDSTVAVWYALANSMNLPTVDLYFKLGRKKLINTCSQLGFPPVTQNAPSIALGTLDLSLSEVVRAYTAFANKGMMPEMVMINKITDAKGEVLYEREDNELVEVFSPQTSEEITAILQRAINQGTGTRIRRQFGIGADLAGKTGTAQNNSNAWFIAYTPNLVLGTWVGARSPEVHFNSGNGTGSALALPIVGGVLKAMERNPALKQLYLQPFILPEDILTELQCDPYQQKGVKGFFNRLFSGKTTANDSIQEQSQTQPQPEKKSGVKNFFKKLFKKK